MASESELPLLHAAEMLPVKLTPENYFLWKTLVVPILQQYDMFNIVQGTEHSADDLPRRDRECMTFIKLTLSESMQMHAEGCTTARALWLKLEERGKFAATSLTLIRSRLKTMKKESSMSMSTYYQSAKEIAHTLALAGSPVSDGEFAKYVLEGLPADYAAFVNLMRPRSDALTPEELHNLLVEEEANRKRELYFKVIKYGIIGLVIPFVAYTFGAHTGYHVGYIDGSNSIQ